MVIRSPNTNITTRFYRKIFEYMHTNSRKKKNIDYIIFIFGNIFFFRNPDKMEYLILYYINIYIILMNKQT